MELFIQLQQTRGPRITRFFFFNPSRQFNLKGTKLRALSPNNLNEIKDTYTQNQEQEGADNIRYMEVFFKHHEEQYGTVRVYEAHSQI